VKAALPDWLVFGNIREMHQPIAAGTAIEASVDDNGVTHLGALIVDPSSVKKVKTGVLKGFSHRRQGDEAERERQKSSSKASPDRNFLVDRPRTPTR
jgi:hypothetical protein